METTAHRTVSAVTIADFSSSKVHGSLVEPFHADRKMLASTIIFALAGGKKKDSQLVFGKVVDRRAPGGDEQQNIEGEAPHRTVTSTPSAVRPKCKHLHQLARSQAVALRRRHRRMLEVKKSFWDEA